MLEDLNASCGGSGRRACRDLLIVIFFKADRTRPLLLTGAPFIMYYYEFDLNPI